jgi:hypothetical protein
MPTLLEDIKKKVEQKIAAKKALLTEEETVLTDEEKEGLDEAAIAELIEAKKKMKEEEDDKECDDEEDKKDDEEDDDEEVDVDESLAKIFADAKIDESVQKDLTTLFNVVVAEKVIAKCDEMSEKYEQQFNESIQAIEDNVDKYISFVADEWIKENELQVETGIKVELAESFITGMRNLFVENYVDVPEDKIDLVAEAEETIQELTSKLDESTNKTLELTEQINTLKKVAVINEISSELTETQKEKLGTLIDSIEYKDDDTYKNQVQLVIEKYFVVEPKEEFKEEVLDDRMKMYLAAGKKK